MKELMQLDDKSIDDIQKYLSINSNSIIYDWLDDVSTPRFHNVIKLADLFNCSIDYILNITDNLEKVSTKELPSFRNQFKKVVYDRNFTQNKIINDKILSHGHIATINKNRYLSTENMIKLADYLGVSIDFLVGRG